MYTCANCTVLACANNEPEKMPKNCPMDGVSKREDMKQLIFLLSKNIPMIRANLFGAIKRNLDDWKINN